MQPFRHQLTQAALDLRAYYQIAPGNAFYSHAKRVILAREDFRPRLITPDPNQVLGHSLLRSGYLGIPEVATMPVPARAVPIETLRALMHAMATSSALEIRYRSMSGREPAWREITPHAFGHDGFRWHARAFCHRARRFKDFVLGRIVETGDTVPGKAWPEDDKVWEEFVDLRFTPHPGLTQTQRQAIEQDYGMVDGVGIFRVRRAMLHYVKHQLRFDEPSADPVRQQIMPLNLEEIERGR